MSLLNKLFIGNATQATDAIIITYKNQGYAVINFLYFGNAMHQRVFEKPLNDKQQIYAKALSQSEYLLADGIALQIFNKAINRKRAQNLNGTDFVPKFITQLIKRNETIHIALRSVYDPKINKGKEQLDKACQHFHDRFGQRIDYSWQCRYSERNRGRNKKDHEASLQNKKAAYNVLINCSGSPFQETRTREQKKRVQKNRIIVINAGGFVDFLSGFETRAPKRVRNMRIGETFRRVARNPRKNFKKLRWMFGICRLVFTYQSNSNQSIVSREDNQESQNKK